MIIWTIVLVIVIAGLTVYGFKLKEINRGPNMEKAMVEQGKKYLNKNRAFYPEMGNSFKITSERLKNEGYDPKLEDECVGYFVVKSQGEGYEFNGYVSCPDYKTEGYQNIE